VEPVLQAWENDEVPLEEYAAGSGGPRGAKVAPQPGAERKQGTAAGDDPRSG
jgi:glucose-6-phosphate 1-dehydrogenase